LKQLTLQPVVAKNKRSKQVRIFQTLWLEERKHWLVYTKGQGMFCSLCEKYNKCSFNRDAWNDKPCKRLRLQSIVGHMHESSAAHKDAVKLELAALASVNILGALNPSVPAIGMEQAFSCLYFLAKHHIAHTTNYELLLALLDINITVRISIAKNATDMSNKTIQEMVFRGY